MLCDWIISDLNSWFVLDFQPQDANKLLLTCIPVALAFDVGLVGKSAKAQHATISINDKLRSVLAY